MSLDRFKVDTSL